jgi:ATP-binding cassette subfamily B multidrug efflux pump
VFRFFENLVDPYEAYAEDDVPPTRLWPFLLTYVRPFKRVFWAAGIMSVIVATVEIWLISYMGRLIDLIAPGSEESVWADHGLEFFFVAVFLLTLRPLLQIIDVALLNQSIIPNFGTIVRWRAHRHVLRQSVGWFENDFAGRIANRIMQTPPAAGEVAFQAFDAVTFSLAYIIGAGVLLMGADPRLLLPLVIWFALYIVLMFAASAQRPRHLLMQGQRSLAALWTAIPTFILSKCLRTMIAKSTMHVRRLKTRAQPCNAKCGFSQLWMYRLSC